MGGLAPLITMAPAPWFLMPFPPVAYDAPGNAATALIAVSSKLDGTLTALGEAPVPNISRCTSCPTDSLARTVLTNSRPANHRQRSRQVVPCLFVIVIVTHFMIDFFYVVGILVRV